MADDHSMSAESAKFHAMTEGTAEDWKIIGKAMEPFARDLPNRVISHLKMLDGDCGGFAVDRLEHSLQPAPFAMAAMRNMSFAPFCMTWAMSWARETMPILPPPS
jgi:predicted HD phosphohydrolase